MISLEYLVSNISHNIITYHDVVSPVLIAGESLEDTLGMKRKFLRGYWWSCQWALAQGTWSLTTL